MSCCSCQGNRETGPLPPNPSTVLRTELGRHGDTETRHEGTRQTQKEGLKANSVRFHFFPPASLFSTSSVPSLRNYFSCLIGLWVEDVPGVCHGEIAMFSKCPSGLGCMRWGPILLSRLKPPEKCSEPNFHMCTFFFMWKCIYYFTLSEADWVFYQRVLVASWECQGRAGMTQVFAASARSRYAKSTEPSIQLRIKLKLHPHIY